MAAYTSNIRRHRYANADHQPTWIIVGHPASGGGTSSAGDCIGHSVSTWECVLVQGGGRASCSRDGQQSEGTNKGQKRRVGFPPNILHCSCSANREPIYPRVHRALLPPCVCWASFARAAEWTTPLGRQIYIMLYEHNTGR